MNKLAAGLVSITFRELLPREVLDLAASTRLQTIEWGGDRHVPPGDGARAREVAHMTREEGLSIAAYGSYYRLGQKADAGPPFTTVLETAAILGAPTIRVWAGAQGSKETGPAERREVVDDALRIARLALERNITISLEYHAGTLTDDAESVRLLREELPAASIEFLWQPAHGETVEQNLVRLRDLGPRLGNVHVFHWWPRAEDRLPLLEGEDRWLRYLDVIGQLPGRRSCLLEFVRGNDPGQFREDAAVLRGWLTISDETGG
jgi:3-dehydroshikimate dehydratase